MNSLNDCSVHFRAKKTRDLFPTSLNNAIGSFDLVYCDLWYSYKISSSCGALYFFTVLDDYARCVWIFLKFYLVRCILSSINKLRMYVLIIKQSLCV